MTMAAAKAGSQSINLFTIPDADALPEIAPLLDAEGAVLVMTADRGTTSRATVREMLRGRRADRVFVAIRE